MIKKPMGDGIRHTIDELGVGGLGLLANLIGGARGTTFPGQDALDLVDGARYIPNAVTFARRSGQEVRFVKNGLNRAEWFWEMPDGEKIKHG